MKNLNKSTDKELKDKNLEKKCKLCLEEVEVDMIKAEVVLKIEEVIESLEVIKVTEVVLT